MTVCAGCPTELPPNNGPGRARKWCSDKCRKRQYAGRCVDCGAATNGSDGRGKRASTRCQDCSHAHERETATWTRERLIAEAQRWHDLTGMWPSSGDWCAPLSAPRSGVLTGALAAFVRATHHGRGSCWQRAESRTTRRTWAPKGGPQRPPHWGLRRRDHP